MKKTIFSTILFILFILFIAIFYLSFFGYETNRFNQIIKSEIKKNNSNIELDFEKISVLLDVKKFVLFVRFINPNIYYYKTSIPLKSLRTDVDLEFLTQKKLVIKKVLLSTMYLDFNKIKTGKLFYDLITTRFIQVYSLQDIEDLWKELVFQMFI